MIEYDGACIVVGTNGFVWYAPSISRTGDYLTLKDAKCIRQWGTSQGLAELINGPLKDTKLDAPASVILSHSQFVFAIPCKVWP
jgi:hypothetical protein